MRRMSVVLAVILAVLLVVAACGKKDVHDVVKDLDARISKMESYQSAGKMVLQTGEEPREYDVEVWYKQPHYYKISLTNRKKDITQIVLRNDEGVFVLTPHLNKSFRFQSNWPNEQGQIYLYQSMVNSIIKDENRQFATDEKNDAYVFDVLADYQNHSMARQKIWLNRKDYAPKKVEISDENAQVLVTLEFSEFQFNRDFSSEDFDMKRNMTSYNLQSLPAMVDEMENGSGAEPAASQQHFGVIEPSYLPEGVKKQSVEDVDWGDGTAVMIRYTGNYHFSILESRPTEQAVTAGQGELVDLGYTWGVLTGDTQKTLRWMSDGVEFRLLSDELPEEEMAKIARSVQGQIGK